MLRRLGFWIGLAAFLALQILPVPAGLSPAAWQTASVAVLMGIWWFTEAVPIPLTGSLPFLLLPLLGVQSAATVSSNYMAPVLFLVIGGAILGLATEKWGLHRRLALLLVKRSSPEPPHLILALMIATASMSMIVNNTATTVMMLPIAAAIAAAVGNGGIETSDTARRHFLCAIFLAIALASNMGGFITPVGTPVNPVVMELLDRQFDVQVSFIQWIGFGLPLVAVALPCAWWLITRQVRASSYATLSRETIASAVGREGPLTRPERRVLIILVLTSASWISLPWLQGFVPGLSAPAVAMIAALALCLLPSGEAQASRRDGRLLEWVDCQKAPWFLVFLLGGGLALADAIVFTGLSDWIGGALGGVSALPFLLLLMVVALICIAVTECASQVGTAVTFMPIVAALAVAGGYDPVPVALAAGLASSWGVANPAGTASNAMVIATGHVPVAKFIRVGAAVDLMGVVLIALVCATIVRVIL
ncbi:MAG: DASS family sodium-coupled anion symporter [Gammaproteobacteria bacterium]|nr:DASS family sodium-coupled anion symporter [Gammaproteobacteria bacterium]